MLALITNDDGVVSDGIAVLARRALRAGLDVVVAAPSWDSSGASASLTAVETDGRFLTEGASIEGVDAPCLGVEAAPAFIVRAALSGAFGPAPDMVLSGVNHGPNTGHAVLHSGTVGAAFTAATIDRPAAAFSLNATTTDHWDTVEDVIDRVLAWLVDKDLAGTVLNINVPDIPRKELRGLRAARLAPFGAVTANVTEVGAGYVSMRYSAPTEDADPDTDVALLDAGSATVTSLAPICEHGSASFAGLTEDDDRPPVP